MVNANFNADLTLTGPVIGNGTIAGQVDLGRTQILLPDSFGGGPPITVEHIHVEPGFVPPMETLARPGAPPRIGRGGSGGLNLNLTVNSTNVIFVRGFGLDAELGGSIRIAGTTENPQPVGGVPDAARADRGARPPFRLHPRRADLPGRPRAGPRL